MSDNRKIIIVGAGITGLTLAYVLSRDGYDVTLVEKEARVGGLARSFSYDGYVYDIGPHRFHTEVPEVNAFIHEILGNDYRTIDRRSGVWMSGVYLDWPLDMPSLLKMPISLLFPVFLDLFRKKETLSGSFEDYITSYYGRTLYEIFFKPYTEKFLHMPCSEISRDWAVTGIDRAVIDNRIKIDGLWSLAGSLFKKTSPLSFIYPKSGGMQVFCDALHEKIISNGGRIFLNTKIERIDRTDGVVSHVAFGGEQQDADFVVWTGTANSLLSLLDEPSPGLDYLSMVLYNYRLNKASLKDYQWCYFGSADIPFNRVSVPAHFNPALAPQGKVGLCVEVTCRRGDNVWEAPLASDQAIRDSLVSVGVLRDPGDTIGLSIEKIENVYPIYSLNYKTKWREVQEQVGKLQNLKLLGRTGCFWYNNMDQSIEMALEFSKTGFSSDPESGGSCHAIHTT